MSGLALRLLLSGIAVPGEKSNSTSLKWAIYFIVVSLFWSIEVFLFGCTIYSWDNAMIHVFKSGSLPLYYEDIVKSDSWFN